MYVPKPGDLVFAENCIYEDHAREVMMYIGEAGNEWYAHNFFNSELKYKFYKSCFSLRSLCRFDIRRLSKRFKHKFKLNEIVEVPLGKTYSTAFTEVEPAQCQILQLKLLYNGRKKKCLPGYRCKLINGDKYGLLAARITRHVTLLDESHLRKILRYNRFWTDETL